MPFIIRFRLICVGQTAHMCVCVYGVYVCVFVGVCGVCAAWRQMLKTKPQQAQRSRRLIKMCSQLQRALRWAVVGVGVPRGVACGIKVPQCDRARKLKGKEATEAKRPQQNGRAVGQLASRKTAVGGRGGTTKGLRVSQCQKYTHTCTHAHTHTYTCTCINLHVRYMQK